jgi:hypothetical protein
MIDIAEVSKIIYKHNYIVKMSLNIASGQITLTFPLIVQYPYRNQKLDTTYDLDAYSIIRSGQKYSIPNYAKRIALFADVVTRCNKIEYNPLFVQFGTKHQLLTELEFFDKLKITLNEAEENNQTMLQDLMTQFLSSERNDKILKKYRRYAKNLSILDGFNSVLNFIT